MTQLDEPFVSWVKKVEQTLCPEYCGVVDRRRVIAYLFLSFVELLVVPYHFALFLTFWEPWGFSAACLHAVALIVVQWLTWRQEISLSRGVAALFLVAAAKLAVDSVFCTVFGQLLDNVSVLGNIFILFILASVAVSLMLSKTAKIITVVTIPLVAFFICSQRPEVMMLSMKPLVTGYLLVLYVFTYNRSRFSKGLRQPREASAEEKKALETIANLKDISDLKAAGLIERLTPETRESLVHHASEHLKKKELDELAWDMICSSLTASEKQICKLILEGYPLKEICSKLNKSESNITSQRSHIRKKLGMSREEDLRRTLEARIAEVRGGGGIGDEILKY